MNAGKGLARELIDTAVTIVAAVLLLRWAWQLVEPMLPVIVIGMAGLVVGRLAINHYRNW